LPSNDPRKSRRFFFLPGVQQVASITLACLGLLLLVIFGWFSSSLSPCPTEGTVRSRCPNSSSICPSAHCPLILPLFFHLSVFAQSPSVSTCFPCLPNHLSILSPTQHSQGTSTTILVRARLVHVGPFPAQTRILRTGPTSDQAPSLTQVRRRIISLGLLAQLDSTAAASDPRSW
jgi:hypothetical protein